MTTASKLLTIALLFGLGLVGFGYTYPGINSFGDPVRGFNARSLGMGSVGIAGVNDPSALFSNPAQLSSLSERQLSVSLGLVPLSEEIISYGVSSPRFYNEPVWLAANQISIGLPQTENLVMAFGVAPRFDLRYSRMKDIYIAGKYQEQENIISDGQIFGLNYGLAWQSGWLTVGGALEYLWGGQNYLWEYLDYYYGTRRYYQARANLRGMDGRLGIDVKLGKKTALNFVYNSPADITDNWDILNATTAGVSPTTDSGQYQFKFPASYGLGLVYRVEEPATEIVAEILKSEWSQVKRQVYNSQTGSYEPADISLKDVVEIHFGVEHYLSENLPLRYGFYLLPYEGDDRFQFLTFTAGLGLVLGRNAQLDFGLEFGRRNFVDETNKTYNYEMLYKYLATMRVKI